jgi:hypothetical protein
MKATLTAQKVIAYTLLVEVGLLIIQYLYMRVFHPEVNWIATDAYMQNAGFFVFQIVGFFIFILLARFVFQNSGENVFRNAVLLFLSGVVVEVGFYLAVQAQYQGAFLYSVMDKIIAIAFALIIVFVVEKKKNEVPPVNQVN